MLDPIYKQLDVNLGPPEHSTKGQHIAATAGFSYHSLLGAIMYAFVTCRLDIGYAITRLPQFSAKPATIHFTLKHLTLYISLIHKVLGHRVLAPYCHAFPS